MYRLAGLIFPHYTWKGTK